jgi:hypothetical protein
MRSPARAKTALTERNCLPPVAVPFAQGNASAGTTHADMPHLAWFGLSDVFESDVGRGSDFL